MDDETRGAPAGVQPGRRYLTLLFADLSASTELPAGRLLCLHTGIHSGLVLLRSGDIELGRFELLGSVPNIASRLSDAAGAHETLVT